jgi:O-antigen/teichoic acid export membrane protein
MIFLKEGINKQALLGLIYKFFSLFLSYLSVRILIHYLGADKYGLWVTISSIVGWVALFDFGLTTGLQNRLVESYVKKDTLLSRKFISTTYLSLALIALIVFLIAMALVFIISPSRIIDTLDLEQNTVLFLFTIMLMASSIMLFLDTYIRVLNSLKQSSKALLAGLIIQIVLLCVYLLLNHFAPQNKLIAVALIKGGLNIVLVVLVTIILFHIHKNLKPSFKYFDKNLIKPLGTIGIQFFIIHLCWGTINSTDNLIISNQLGSAEVTAFSLVYKIISIGKIVFFLLLTPLWPQISEHYHNHNRREINKILAFYFKIMMLINIVVISVSFFLSDIIKIWIGQDIAISTKLILLTTLFIILDNSVGLFTYCLNAMSRIKIQMYLYMLGAILNIPLSLAFVNSPLGSAGVVLASCLCYIPLVVLMPWQLHYELKRMGKYST